MNSFFDLSQKLAQSKPVASCASALKEGNFPLEIQGTEGAFTAMLLAKSIKQWDRGIGRGASFQTVYRTQQPPWMAVL